MSTTRDTGARRATRGTVPDVAADILAAARRPGVAEPVEIRVHPALHEVLLRQGGGGAPLAELAGIPLVVDDDLPSFPGYEVHRRAPGAVVGAPPAPVVRARTVAPGASPRAA